MKYIILLLSAIATTQAFRQDKTVDGIPPIPVPIAAVEEDDPFGKKMDPQRSHDGRIKRLAKGKVSTDYQV